MRLLYSGRKPLSIGMNHAKRVARSADRRDQLAVLRELGPGYPRQHQHHQRLVRQRHAYYRDCYDETERARLATTQANAADAGDAGRAVPEPAAGPDAQ